MTFVCSHPDEQLRMAPLGRDLLVAGDAESFYSLRFSILQCMCCKKVLWSGYQRDEITNSTDVALEEDSGRSILRRRMPTQESKVTDKEKSKVVKKKEDPAILVHARRWRS